MFNEKIPEVLFNRLTFSLYIAIFVSCPKDERNRPSNEINYRNNCAVKIGYTYIVLYYNWAKCVNCDCLDH